MAAPEADPREKALSDYKKKLLQCVTVHVEALEARMAPRKL